MEADGGMPDAGVADGGPGQVVWTCRRADDLRSFPPLGELGLVPPADWVGAIQGEGPWGPFGPEFLLRYQFGASCDDAADVAACQEARWNATSPVETHALLVETEGAIVVHEGADGMRSLIGPIDGPVEALWMAWAARTFFRIDCSGSSGSTVREIAGGYRVTLAEDFCDGGDDVREDHTIRVTSEGVVADEGSVEVSRVPDGCA
jgi:hypothetical protein